MLKIGDLCARNPNIREGLNRFCRLADAYTNAGYNVKAIAICRKISKIGHNSGELPPRWPERNEADEPIDQAADGQTHYNL